MLIVPRRRAATAGLLLDTYTGAAAAYSLRQLRTGVASVVRVRRSSDNTESDFTAAQVTDGTLASWVGAGGNGFVRTWYDQSGNGRDATQASTTTQPQIVSSGSLVLQNSKPTLDFNGTSSRLINSALSISQPVTVFGVCKKDVLTKTADILMDSYNNVQFIIYNKGTDEVTNHRWALNAGLALAPDASEFNNTNLNLIAALFSGANSLLFANGTQRITSAAGTNALSGLSIGMARGNPNPVGAIGFDGKISELIIYASDQSSNRSAIESNINANYSMY